MQWLIDIVRDRVLESMSGIISQWSGLIANIPDGWVLCDGNNGTPDMRGKFVRGPAVGIEAGGEGGNNIQTHTFTTNTHHHHITPTMTADNVDEGYELVGTAQGPPATSDDSATGTTDASDNRPLYYDLLFIMKT